MNNPYYNYTNTIAVRATAVSSVLNTQYASIAAAFGNVDAALKRALKITNLSTDGEVAAVNNSFLQINATGAPTSSATVPFSPSFAGNELRDVGTALVSTSSPNLGQVNQLISTAAYGSPTVINLPSIIGNGLKNLRVNAGATAVEWDQTLPTVTASQSDQLITKDGQWIRAATGENLLERASGGWFQNPTVTVHPSIENDLNYGWSLSSTVFAPADLIAYKTALAHLAFEGQTYTGSFSVFTTFSPSSAPTLQAVIRFFNSSNVEISANASNVTLPAFGQTRRFSVTGVAPAGTAKVSLAIRLATGAFGLFDGLNFSRLKLEQGSIATPWTPSFKDEWFLSAYTQYVSHGQRSDDSFFYSRIGLGFGGGSTLEFASSIGVDYAAALRSPGESVALGQGKLVAECREFTVKKLLGFSAVHDNGTYAATGTLDFANGQKQKAAINQNTTITITALPVDFVADGLRLNITNLDAIARTPTFTSLATIRWKGGVAPAAIAASGETEYLFYWDGARFLGSWSPA
jgi:hypothetical protein